MKFKTQIAITLVMLFLPMLLNAQEVNQEKADSLYSTACNAVLKDNIDYALKCLDEGMPLASEQLQRKYNWLYGHIYDRFGGLILYDDYIKAYQYYQTAYEYYSKGRSYKNMVSVLEHMGTIMKNMRQYNDALELWDLAIYIADRYNFIAVDVLVDQKKLYEELKQYDMSASVSQKLYFVYQVTSDIEDKIKVLLQLAKDARVDADYALAMAYYEEMDKLSSQLSEDSQRHYAALQYIDKHVLLGYMGLYDEAVKYALHQIPIYERHPEYKDSLVSLYIDLAEDYSCLSDKEKSRESINKALDVLATVQLDKARLASMYSMIGQIYAKLGNTKGALSFYEKAEVNGYSEGSLCALRGAAVFAEGNKKAAREEYRKYSESIRSEYGESSLYYAQSLQYMANLNAFCKDFDEASLNYIAAAELTRQEVYESMRYLSRSHRNSFWNQCSSLFLQMAGFGLKAGFEQDEFTEAAYNSLLLSKGLLLASDRSLSSAVNESNDEELVKIYNQCQKLYTDIEVQMARGAAADQLRELNNSLHKLEIELQTRISQHSEYLSFLDIDYKDVQSVMSENELVIDFTDFAGVKDSDRRFYAAFVYRKDWQYPKMIRMFEEKDIAKLLEQSTYSWGIYEEKVARKLDELLMRKIKSYIKDDDVVYWIPSGSLHKISVESLLMQSRPDMPFSIRRLSSARQLTDRNKSLLMKSAVLYGGLQYDMNAEELIASQSQDDIPLHMYATRSKGHKNGFDPLPQSYEEVYAVKEIIESDTLDVAVLDGKKGTEYSFVRMSGNSPQILHVSTHGFYYTPEEAISVDALSGYKNAMLLSGLVLSGGNSEWKGTSANTDYLGGLLTADDISKLDLSGTELVVMSACGTGQGEVTSEGVYGLQRAFKMAGVKQLVMTLWQVNDYVSKEFMKRFYENLIYKRQEPDTALHEAKKEIREEYHDPYYWAGYVLLD